MEASKLAREQVEDAKSEEMTKHFGLIGLSLAVPPSTYLSLNLGVSLKADYRKYTSHLSLNLRVSLRADYRKYSSQVSTEDWTRMPIQQNPAFKGGPCLATRIWMEVYPFYHFKDAQLIYCYLQMQATKTSALL